MSRTERAKGARGQREALDVLTERGWQVVEANAGRATEDLFAVDPAGRPVAVEVKYQAALRWGAFRAQARAQAKARGAAWLLMCRVPEHPFVFVVEGPDFGPTVWRGNGARKESNK